MGRVPCYANGGGLGGIEGRGAQNTLSPQVDLSRSVLVQIDLRRPLSISSPTARRAENNPNLLQSTEIYSRYMQPLIVRTRFASAMAQFEQLPATGGNSDSLSPVINRARCRSPGFSLGMKPSKKSDLR